MKLMVKFYAHCFMITGSQTLSWPSTNSSMSANSKTLTPQEAPSECLTQSKSNPSKMSSLCFSKIGKDCQRHETSELATRKKIK